MNKNRKNQGITLVALVITIIMLLILSGVTIASITNSNMFEKAKLAKEKYENEKKLENTLLSEYENEIDRYITGSRESSGVKFETLFESVSGVTNGTLSKNIEEYDLVLCIFGSPVNSQASQSSILSPNLKKMIAFDFSLAFDDGTTHSIYGTFSFNGNGFSRTISRDTFGWEQNYLMYKVVGIKY